MRIKDVQEGDPLRSKLDVYAWREKGGLRFEL